MDKSKKRERNVNFSREETEKLLSLVEFYINIIENKKSDATTWQEKEKTWKSIETMFNSHGAVTFRDSKHLKLKYEALKRDIRKKTSGGVNGASPLSPVEKKVMKMISLSVGGAQSIYDSEPLESSTSEESGDVVVPDTIKEEPISYDDTIRYDTGAADYSNNATIGITEEIVKVEILEQEQNDPLTSQKVNHDMSEPPQKKRAEWKPKKCPGLCKPKAKNSFNKFTEQKIEIAVMQKKILEEELEERKIKKQMLQDEMQHKKEMYQLEIEQMLLQIEILKSDLKSKNKL